jgi:hypothetical protein
MEWNSKRRQGVGLSCEARQRWQSVDRRRLDSVAIAIAGNLNLSQLAIVYVTCYVPQYRRHDAIHRHTALIYVYLTSFRQLLVAPTVLHDLQLEQA